MPIQPLLLGSRDFIHRARHLIIGTPSEGEFFEWLLELAAFGRGQQASSAILATEHIRELIALTSTPRDDSDSKTSWLSSCWVFSSAHLWTILNKMGCRLFEQRCKVVAEDQCKAILPIFQIPEPRKNKGMGKGKGICPSFSSSLSSSSVAGAVGAAAAKRPPRVPQLQSSSEDNLRLVLEVLLVCLTHDRVAGLSNTRFNPSSEPGLGANRPGNTHRGNSNNFGWYEAAATLGALSIDSSLRGAQIQLEHSFREILKRLVDIEERATVPEPKPIAVPLIASMLLSYTTRPELICVCPSIGKNLGKDMDMPPMMRFRCSSKIVLFILNNMYFLNIEPALQLRFDVAARLLLVSLEVGKIQAAETVAAAAAVMAASSSQRSPQTQKLPRPEAAANYHDDEPQAATKSLKWAPATGIMDLKVVEAAHFDTLDLGKKIVSLKESMEEDEEDWDLLHDLVLMLRMCESFCGRKRSEEAAPEYVAGYFVKFEKILHALEVRRQGFNPEVAKYTELLGSFKGQISSRTSNGTRSL